MEARVGHLRCRYRVLGSHTGGASFVSRLESLARAKLLRAYSDALNQAFLGDPGVYVVRHVPAHVAFTNIASEEDDTLARKWGERLCGAVVRAVAAASNASSNVARFENQAEYVAHFIVDLLGGRAWNCWFYGSFKSLRGLSEKDAILAVLGQNRNHLAAIFRYLKKQKRLDLLLTTLNREGAESLWFDAIALRKPQPDRESLRPFFAAALHLLRKLELWPGTESSEAALLIEYMATHPVAPDWSSRQALAAAVLDVIRFLKQQGYAAAKFSIGEEIIRQCHDQLRAKLDWLDLDWLLAEMAQLSLLSTPPDHRKPMPSTAPSHRLLLERIRELLRGGSISLDHAQPDSIANALKVYAALAASDFDLEKSPGAARIIERLLLAWRYLQEPPEHAALLHAFETQDIGAASELPPPGARASAQRAFEAIQELGSAAAEILRELVPAERTTEKPAASGQIWTSSCAGLFLLLRALLDSRVPQLVVQSGFASVSEVLLALGIEWAGERSLRGGGFDPGVLVWAGIDPNDKPPQITGKESSAFLSSLLQLLHSRSAVDPSVAQLSEVSLRGRQALIMADASGAIWPLGLWLEGDIDRAGARASLIAQWSHATGVEPEVTFNENCQHVFEPAFKELTAAWPESVPISLSVTLSAVALVRLWARWLPGISRASVPYLLNNFIRREGTVQRNDRELIVRLQPAQMEIVLEMAGYTQELETVSWLGGRKVVFQVERRP